MHRLKANVALFKAALARRDLEVLKGAPPGVLSAAMAADLQAVETSLVAMEATV